MLQNPDKDQVLTIQVIFIEVFAINNNVVAENTYLYILIFQQLMS